MKGGKEDCVSFKSYHHFCRRRQYQERTIVALVETNHHHLPHDALTSLVFLGFCSISDEATIRKTDDDEEVADPTATLVCEATLNAFADATAVAANVRWSATVPYFMVNNNC